MIELMVVDLTLLSSSQKLNNFYVLKHPRMVKNCGKGPKETKKNYRTTEKKIGWNHYSKKKIVID